MQLFDLFGILICGLFLPTLAVRIIVDDANSTWMYSGPWTAITPSTPCSACLLQPDPSKVYNSTWHDTINPSTAQLAFYGVSIEVYAICPQLLYINGAATPYGTLNVSFTLDHVGDGLFNGPQTGCDEYTYNYLAYARTNLTLSAHVFQIATTPVENNGGMLLDYAIYDDGTVPSPSPLPPSTPPIPTSTSHSSIPTATIAGTGAVAGILLLANIAQFVWYYRKSRKFRLQAGITHQGSALPVPPVQQEPLPAAQSYFTRPNDMPPSISLAATSHLPASGKHAPNTETMNQPDISKL